ncbi:MULTISPECIES: MFS transporter [Prevotellaceae]|uniref:Major Facilitator Superfamily transporter n=2 Tax=Prevotella dentalis (strain ATCC 49559 / DSM 3688 / JCM 13448 / NCTC 12043 / ES 2772) TaxID=908937 RepID=L0JBH0_PREDD|nr:MULTISPECIES: MFS transporter [Prevotellaceae]AGB28213.1 Major Facilitator Superfamily transporter [Prevotella dentalis DSM 3688]
MKPTPQPPRHTPGSPSRSPWLWVPSLTFSDSLPSVAVMTISVILYKQLGLSNAAITFYTSWLYLPWVLKPVWSPFIDLVKTKRTWILAMEVLIGAAFGGIAFTIPTSLWLQGSLFFFWLMAFAGASHCVAADGFYMLGLNGHQQAGFMGIRTLFDRLATIFGQGILVMIAGNLQVIFRNSISYSWSLMFYGVTGLFLALWLWHSHALPYAREDVRRSYINARTIWSGFLDTFRSFFTKPQVVYAVLFILFFRMPEGLLSKVSELFLIDAGHNGGLGLSPQEYGLVQGTVGIIGIALGGILGGVVASRDGLRRWLWPMVFAFMLPEVVYVFLSYTLPSSLLVVNACVFVEQFGYGFGLTAYMLYLIYYSRGEFKTSHYALASAMMFLSMMLPGVLAGTLQEQMGYRHFFIFTLVSCIVMVLVTAFLKIDPAFGKSKEEN